MMSSDLFTSSHPFAGLMTQVDQEDKETATTTEEVDAHPMDTTPMLDTSSKKKRKEPPPVFGGTAVSETAVNAPGKWNQSAVVMTDISTPSSPLETKDDSDQQPQPHKRQRTASVDLGIVMETVPTDVIYELLQPFRDNRLPVYSRVQVSPGVHVLSIECPGMIHLQTMNTQLAACNRVHILSIRVDFHKQNIAIQFTLKRGEEYKRENATTCRNITEFGLNMARSEPSEVRLTTLSKYNRREIEAATLAVKVSKFDHKTLVASVMSTITNDSNHEKQRSLDDIDDQMLGRIYHCMRQIILWSNAIHPAQKTANPEFTLTKEILGGWPLRGPHPTVYILTFRNLNIEPDATHFEWIKKAFPLHLKDVMFDLAKRSIHIRIQSGV